MRSTLKINLPILVVLGITALIYGAPYFFGGDDSARSSEEQTPTTVTVTPVLRGDLRETYLTVGSATALSEVKLVSQLGGIVESIEAQVGSAVKQGQVLATLDNRLISADIIQAEAQARRSAAELARVQQLFDSNIAEARRFEAAQAQQQIDQAVLERLQTQLSLSRFPSPFDGIVTGRFADTGDSLTPGATLFTLANVDRMRILVKVPETVAARLVEGASAAIVAATFPGEEMTAQVANVYPASDPLSHQTTIELDAGTVFPRLQPGALVEVRLTIAEHRQTLYVDRSVLPDAEAADTVDMVVASNGVAERRTVQLGAILDEHIQIRDGLDAGDMVIVRGGSSLAGGEPIQIMGDTAAAGN
jgi:membrane fusion protein (multidrug efflux system)